MRRLLSGPLSGHTHVGETLGETRCHQHVLKRKLYEKGARDVNNAWFKYFTLKRYSIQFFVKFERKNEFSRHHASNDITIA